MKTLIFISAVFFHTLIYGQTENEKKLVENSKLTGKTYTTKVSPEQAAQSVDYKFGLSNINLDKVNFTILKVSGNTKLKSIDVSVQIESQNDNREITVKNISASDFPVSAEVSDKNTWINGSIENDKINLQKQQPVEIILHFDNYPTDKQWLRIFKFDCYMENVTGTTTTTKSLEPEFKDLIIRWD